MSKLHAWIAKHSEGPTSATEEALLAMKRTANEGGRNECNIVPDRQHRISGLYTA